MDGSAKQIDYEALTHNLRQMINVLEYDSMRSPGKAKINSQHLHSMHYLLDKYKDKVKQKPAPVKEA